MKRANAAIRLARWIALALLLVVVVAVTAIRFGKPKERKAGSVIVVVPVSGSR